MPQLERVYTVLCLDYGSRTAGEGGFTVSCLAVGKELVVGVIREKFCKDLSGSLGIGIRAERLDLVESESGDRLGDEKSAVECESCLMICAEERLSPDLPRVLW